MPRYNVQNKNGEWACFSTIVDDFITEFMPRNEYQAWREREYGIHCGEIEDANLMSYEEAVQAYLCEHKVELDWDKIQEYESPCDYCNHWRNNSCNVVEDYELKNN